MALYRVFAPAKGDIKLPEGVQLVESYPAFAVVSAIDEALTELRKHYPVEKLDRPEEPSTSRSIAAPASAKVGSGKARRRDVIIRFKSPVRPGWLKAIEKLGVEVKRPLGASAVVASSTSEKVLNKVRSHAKVERVDPYVPEIRVSPGFFQNLVGQADEKALGRAAARLASGEVQPPSNRVLSVPNTVVATFLTEADRSNARKVLAREQIHDVYDGGETQLVINLSGVEDSGAAMSKVVDVPGLVRVEEKTIPKLRNNVARMVIGQGVVLSNPSGLGLTGKGEVASVADTGLDTGDPTTVHADFRGRIKDIKSFPIASSWTSLVTNPGGDDGPGDLFSGHGTHTTGSVLGDGSRAVALGLSPIRGMAPEARLVFQAIEQAPKWTAAAQLSFLQQGVKPPSSGLYGIPDDLRRLFQAAYDQGARVHSNSWGGGSEGRYDGQSESVDRFVWEHRDFLVLFAVGNDGKEESPGGTTIALGSISPPATAKNCVTVGACENDRPTEFITATYGHWWPDDFPNGEISKDKMTDSIDHLAAFSSRGPCETGRRKPDVVAPGTFVLSTRSSRIAGNNFGWAAYPPAKDDYMYDCGTSMATPLVAGAAALVRQYLRRTAGIKKPSASLMKAVLIHSARYAKYGFADPSSAPFADNEQGWGRVTLRDVLAPQAPTKVLFVDEGPKLATGQSSGTKVKVGGSGVPLRVTLVYTDFPGEYLINNLNLIVTDPNGKFYLGNDFNGSGSLDPLNNVEGVVIQSPSAGQWTVNVVASEVQQGPQTFALVISGADLALSTAPGPAAPTVGSERTPSRRKTVASNAAPKNGNPNGAQSRMKKGHKSRKKGS